MNDVNGNSMPFDSTIKKFSVSATLSDQIDAYMLRGANLLEIERTGSGMNDTKYNVFPIQTQLQT